MSTRAPTVGTLSMEGTRLTDSLRKAHPNDRFAMPIGNDAPRLPGLRSWASHLMRLPIDAELAVIKAKSLLSLANSHLGAQARGPPPHSGSDSRQARPHQHIPYPPDADLEAPHARLTAHEAPP